MIDFQAWLLERGVDCQTLTAELQAALQSQFEAEQQQQAPVTHVLVVPIDCSWPSRGYWITTGVAL